MVGAAALAWREAATIIMLSRTTRRVLLLRRGRTAAFMPNALVFPGGVVHTEPEIEETGREAAMRELFEETGVLCMEGEEMRLATDCPRTESWQNKVNEKGAPKDKLRQLLGDKRRLDTSSLVNWSTWLTPNAGHYKRRYMTDFFVLPVDGEPAIRPCSREMAGAEWCDPRNVLKEAHAGTESVPPPQQYELNRLKDVEPDDLASHCIRKVLFPQLVKTEIEGGEEIMCNLLPGDYQYIMERPGQFNQGTRRMRADEILKPDDDKPLHRLTYLANPLYAKCKIDIRGVNPLDLEEINSSILQV